MFVAPAVAVRGDVRNVHSFQGGDTRFSDVLYTIGLTYAFGGKEEVKEVAAAPAPEPAPAPAPEVKQEVVTPPPPAPVEEKGAYVFRNIYFDFDKSIIKTESEPILDEVSDFLKAHPDMKMEVQGHTDSKGTDEYNMNLSDRRAAAVKAYLVKDEAIKEDRLTTKGYGETKPADTNDTAEGRAKNRRVEFVPIQ
jgi:OmpA-OmpF porin, OOP family